MVQSSLAMQEPQVAGLIPGSGRPPWKRAWQPTPVFLSGGFHGQQSLVGSSPRGHRELDTTEVSARAHTCTQ